MTAEQVRAYVAAKWPGSLCSPLAQAMHGASALALLESSDADRVIELRAIAMERAEACINARDGWCVETLSVQIECAVDGELSTEECDELARQALGA